MVQALPTSAQGLADLVSILKVVLANVLYVLLVHLGRAEAQPLLAQAL
jgi:hypothetical protein